MNQELQANVDAKLDKMIEHFYREVPHATYQRDSKEIDKEYFIRHTVETALRIRHKRMIDALVIHYFAKHDPKQAKAWAQYTEDEMLHGHMFAKDVERIGGPSVTQVHETEPLLATKLLNGYFYFTLEHEGPMAALASAYFLEYTTRKTQPVWLDNLERVLGKENVKGARGHVEHDIRESHTDFVWNVLMSTVKTAEDEERLMRHLDSIYGLFAAYFVEIYQVTVGKRKGEPQRGVASTAVSFAANAVAV